MVHSRVITSLPLICCMSWSLSCVNRVICCISWSRESSSSATWLRRLSLSRSSSSSRCNSDSCLFCTDYINTQQQTLHIHTYACIHNTHAKFWGRYHLVFLVIGATIFKKASVSVTSNRTGEIFGRIVPRVNMHRLMESDFRYDVTLSRCRPWHAATWWVTKHLSSTYAVQ